MKLIIVLNILILFSFCTSTKDQNEGISPYEIVLDNEFPRSDVRELILNFQLLNDDRVKKHVCKQMIEEVNSIDLEFLCSFKNDNAFQTIEQLKLKRNYYVFDKKNLSEFEPNNYENMPYGVISLSNILTTDDPNIILIYIEKYFSGWDGFGKVYVLKKKENRWHIKNIYTSWKS
ncbi:MAG: hypothetical protein GX159_09975 [Flavobacteriaceae bacterium]|nr:hypothetical protein [Flavobacteriaceae bacterium]